MRYDDEFKKQILDAFFESGQSLRKFATDYGMGRNTLYLWAREDPRYVVMKKKAVWERYPPEYKYQAVQMVIIDGLSSHKVAEIMGCKYGALVSGWVRAYKQKGAIGLEPPEQPIGTEKPDTGKARISKATSLEEYVRELETKNEKLEKENKRLRFEADVAHAAAKVKSKKEPGLDVSLLSNVEKTEIIDMLRPRYLLKELLAYLGMAPSSYEYREHIKEHLDKYAYERELVVEAYVESRSTYGYRRIAASINKAHKNRKISERIVRRIMREEYLQGRQCRSDVIARI